MAPWDSQGLGKEKMCRRSGPLVPLFAAMVEHSAYHLIEGLRPALHCAATGGNA